MPLPQPGRGRNAAPTTLAIQLYFARLAHRQTPMSTSDSPVDMSFQDLILRLQEYWAERGCVIMQPYDMEMGAGTFHPATFLRAVGPEPCGHLPRFSIDQEDCGEAEQE